MSDNIAVFGAGAIGGVIGGYLARAGREVTLIDGWPANVERIREHGLKVTAVEEEFSVPIKALHLGEVSARQPQFDVAFLAVKSYDTRWMTALIEPHLAHHGFVVSAQNGINEQTIGEVIGPSRVVGCVVTLGAGMYEPGHVERTNAADRLSFTVGEPDGSITTRLDKLVETLTPAGPARTTTNLAGHRWAKLATNCMSNAVAGITGLRSRDLRLNPEVRAVSIRIAGELLDVAEALEVNVEPIGGVPADLYRAARSDAGRRKELEQRMIDAGKNIGSGRPSLAQDVLKGRKTEVNELNGHVAARGRQLGIDTPVNDAVVAVTQRVECGELEQSLGNLKYLAS